MLSGGAAALRRRDGVDCRRKQPYRLAGVAVVDKAQGGPAGVQGRRRKGGVGPEDVGALRRRRLRRQVGQAAAVVGGAAGQRQRNTAGADVLQQGPAGPAAVCRNAGDAPAADQLLSGGTAAFGCANGVGGGRKQPAGPGGVAVVDKAQGGPLRGEDGRRNAPGAEDVGALRRQRSGQITRVHRRPAGKRQQDTAGAVGAGGILPAAGGATGEIRETWQLGQHTADLSVGVGCSERMPGLVGEEAKLGVGEQIIVGAVGEVVAVDGGAIVGVAGVARQHGVGRGVENVGGLERRRQNTGAHAEELIQSFGLFGRRNSGGALAVHPDFVGRARGHANAVNLLPPYRADGADAVDQPLSGGAGAFGRFDGVGRRRDESGDSAGVAVVNIARGIGRFLREGEVGGENCCALRGQAAGQAASVGGVAAGERQGDAAKSGAAAVDIDGDAPAGGRALVRSVDDGAGDADAVMHILAGRAGAARPINHHLAAVAGVAVGESSAGGAHARFFPVAVEAPRDGGDGSV